jgi:hypothetical protein
VRKKITKPAGQGCRRDDGVEVRTRRTVRGSTDCLRRMEEGKDVQN